MHSYKQNLKSLSQQLRKDMTGAEQLLWSKLRRKKMAGIQFNRQKPLGNYIVDFYAHKASLVVEVDGSQHYEEPQQNYDQVRTKYLEGQGLVVLRFNNLQVLQETDAVVQHIDDVVRGLLGSEI